MSLIFDRVRGLIRPTPSDAAADPAKTLAVDLVLAAAGMAIFGLALATGGDWLWRLTVAAKVSAAVLCAFVLSLAPLYALKRFFDVEIAFGTVVSACARYLALGGVFAAAAAGPFALARHGEPAFDGPLALVMLCLVLVAVLICAPRGRTQWLPPLPALLAVTLFLSLLGQSGWAFRPYMDPRSPTLFDAHAEWLTGHERAALEGTILHFAPQRPGAGPTTPAPEH